jgi:ketosteroid isomerase-like protein
MKTVLGLGRVFLFVGLIALGSARADAQVPGVPAFDEIKSQAELDKAVAALDAALFDTYNRCDLEKFAKFFTDDVEFYHDQGGLSLGKQKLVDSIQKNICGGDVRRELVPGSLEVYHMNGYGAVEIGVHRFYHPKTNSPAGEAKFVHLWQYKDGAWKITRVISFDHHVPGK